MICQGEDRRKAELESGKEPAGFAEFGRRVPHAYGVGSGFSQT